MSNLDEKIKKWIELIQTKDLNPVIEDIQVHVPLRLTETTNKQIFKLLLHLSHTADKCSKENCTIGDKIHKLTRLLCSTLIEIPDSNKFVCSLFHIVRCLLTLCMYKEAFDVCSCLKTEALCHSNENVSNILVKIAYLWYMAVNNAFLTLQNDPSNLKHYYNLRVVINHELDIIQVSHKNYTKQLLTKISSYLDKIASTSKEPNIYFTDFYRFISEYLNQTSISLIEDEKNGLSQHMFHIVSRIVCENINEKCLESGIFSSTLIPLNTISDYFKTILTKNEECYQCFQQFQCFYLIFLKPVEHLVNSDAESIRDLCDNYTKLSKQYGYTGSIKWMTFSIVQILDPLLLYWEACIKNGKKAFLENGILLEVMNLVAHMTLCFIEQTPNKCKSCLDKDCMVKRDIYNAIVIKTRCIMVIIKLSENDLSRDICKLARKFLEQNIGYIHEMKKSKCKSWTYLWSNCGSLIYNLIIMSERIYEESVSLISLLLTAILEFEGVQQKSRYIKLQNPLSATLHRLCCLHYNRGMYREAMTAAALNALLSYNDPDTKAFQMWAYIKHKSVTSKEIMETTMLACLKADEARIKELGLSIDFSQYDLVAMCLREAKGLQEAKVNLSVAIRKVLDEMTLLKVNPMQYARAVQMLAYHLLNFDFDNENLDCVQRALSMLKKSKTYSTVMCLQANLEFHVFVKQLRVTNRKTKTEMENTKFALYAQKLSEIGENMSGDVVPAYSMVNIKEDSRIRSYLEVPLKKWTKCLKQNVDEIVKSDEPRITLHTLIIAGEYARLYRYEECEINIWKLAYKLAFALQDNSAIIYITGRSISSREIDRKWITTAKELAVKLKDTNDKNIVYAIAVFWISLSDFYFECGIHDKARNLLDESKKLKGISFGSNIAVYLYSLDRILCNCYLYKEDVTYEEYSRYIVESLYTMITLSEELSLRKWKPQDKHLFGLDILLSATVNLSLRINSSLSFREIGSHLVRRLRTAQAIGATIRVAEILKSLCYIDLSRSQLNDCEVKLQGLEHILNIEMVEASMKSKLIKTILENASQTPIRIVDPIRDIPQNDASPILRNKVFDLPEFLCHESCNCYACTNVSYRYLVFASTHIRAQLYALQQNYGASLQHFHGAFKIKDSMNSERFAFEDEREYISWQDRFYSTDYVLLLINFSYLLRSYSNRMRDEVTNIARLAMRICDMYKLKGHPIYMSVQELLLDERFQKMCNSIDYSTFTVPDASDIDISKYLQTPKAEESICITPVVTNARKKKPINIRRVRTPPLLNLTKVSMNFSDDEDNDSSLSSGHKRTRIHGKLTRRKILDEDYSEVAAKTEEKNSCVSMRDIVNKIVPLVPDVSEHLCKTVDDIDEPATNENVQKLIERMENLKLNITPQRKIWKTRNSSDCNKIDEAIALLKDLDVNEGKSNVDLSDKKESTSRQNATVTPIIKVTENNVTVEERNQVDNSKNTRRITRTRSVVTKETKNTRTRKSKECK
ncbi:uncharacterized protein LOC128889288 isoform X1 [Hylaeus anthracinus]|uniref:uncharacterized protein LOC128889288 isoform X1 n=2 Tax=Hylaeus anthracinus TaxID=313031 RepID=UPI0023B9C33B|nr:uncharacterized protein LOC128889288 isoform X1 [Hylaeus anthracinus]